MRICDCVCLVDISSLQLISLDYQLKVQVQVQSFAVITVSHYEHPCIGFITVISNGDELAHVQEYASNN